MRRIVLVVGIGAGLFGMATLHNTDSMAVELVRKTNFNLPTVVLPPPAPEYPVPKAPPPSVPPLAPIAPLDLLYESDKPGDYYVPKLVLKKNFNVPGLAYPNEKVISVDLADPDPYDGPSPDPTELADEVYYRPPVMFPLPNGGNDHADSPDRTAGNDRRRSPRP